MREATPSFPAAPPIAGHEPFMPGATIEPPVVLLEPAGAEPATVITRRTRREGQGFIRRHAKKAALILGLAGVGVTGLAAANYEGSPEGNGAIADAPQVGEDATAEFCAEGVATANESFALAAEDGAAQFLHESPAAGQLTNTVSLIEFGFKPEDADEGIEEVVCRNPATLAALTAVVSAMRGPSEATPFNQTDINALHQRYLTALNSGDEEQFAGVLEAARSLGALLEERAVSNDDQLTGDWMRIGGLLDTSGNVQIGFINQAIDQAPNTVFLVSSVLNDAGANPGAINSLVFFINEADGQIYVNEAFGNNQALNIPEEQGPAGEEVTDATSDAGGTGTETGGGSDAGGGEPNGEGEGCTGTGSGCEGAGPGDGSGPGGPGGPGEPTATTVGGGPTTTAGETTTTTAGQTTTTQRATTTTATTVPPTTSPTTVPPTTEGDKGDEPECVPNPPYVVCPTRADGSAILPISLAIPGGVGLVEIGKHRRRRDQAVTEQRTTQIIEGEL